MPTQPKWTKVEAKSRRGLHEATLYSALLVVLASSGALFAQSPEQQAWKMLKAGVEEKNAGKRTQAVKALRLLPNDPQAAEIVRTALKDPKTEVRVAAANSLGLMKSKESIPELKAALSDPKPAVILAAAHSLQTLDDPSGYGAYYQLLTGERKPTEGLIARELGRVNTKAVMEFGVEEGLGFLPFADEGYTAVKVIRKDNSSPVRALAARALVKDSDPRVNQTLVHIATSDKSWLVRASALLAIAKRENPGLLVAIVPALSDRNRVVRYTAAAAVIRLTAAAARNEDSKTTSSISGQRFSQPPKDRKPALAVLRRAVELHVNFIDTYGQSETPSSCRTICTPHKGIGIRLNVPEGEAMPSTTQLRLESPFEQHFTYHSKCRC